MKCPKCKNGELREIESMSLGFRNKRLIYKYFCPLCDYERKKEIPISFGHAMGWATTPKKQIQIKN